MSTYEAEATDHSVPATARLAEGVDDILMVEDSLYGRKVAGYPIDPERSVNIDGPADWERAERLVIKKLSHG